MNIGIRISQIRGKISRKSFSERIGVVENTLRSYEVGQALPNSKVISAICSEFSVSMLWLVDGVGPIHPDEEASPIVYQTGPDDTDVVWIPMVDAVLSAGHGSFETSDNSERKYAFRLDFITRKGSAKNMVMMRVAGDSMAPEILHNDVVLIDQSKKTITPGHLFAVGFEESIYLKRIDNLPGKVILKSANPAYPPVELDVRGQSVEQFRIIGRVLWSGREYL